MDMVSSPRQREYLSAMAAAGPGPAYSTGAVDTLILHDKKSRPDGAIRKGLIQKSLIHVPGAMRGEVAYSIFGLREYILRALPWPLEEPED
jgi:hypothetical protein